MIIAALLACATTSCVIEDEETEATTTQQVAVYGMLGCSVSPAGWGSTEFCSSVDDTTAVKRVTMMFTERLITIPKENRVYEWTVTGDNAVNYVDGCLFSEKCVFEVRPTCTRQPTIQRFKVTVRIFNPRGGPVLEGLSYVTIGNSTDLFSLGCLGQVFSNCVAPPATAPFLNIISQYCGGMYSMYASQVPGQTHAQVQTRYPGPQSAWNKISDAYTFPGITVDNEYGGCDGEANGDFVGRARACNECGCGPWGPEYPFSYFRGECR